MVFSSICSKIVGLIDTTSFENHYRGLKIHSDLRVNYSPRQKLIFYENFN